MGIRAAAVALLLGGCLQQASTTCGEVICPATFVCDPVHGGCVRPGQLTACGGLADGAAFTAVMTGDGMCDGGVCVQLYCGDGRVTGAEQCDGASVPKPDCVADWGYYSGNGPVTCNPDCTYDRTSCAHICGDDVKDSAE